MGVDFYGCTKCGDSLYSEYVGSCQGCGVSLCTDCLINDEDVNALCEWLKSYPRLTKGSLTVQVEKDWAEYIGTKYAVFNNAGGAWISAWILTDKEASEILRSSI